MRKLAILALAAGLAACGQRASDEVATTDAADTPNVAITAAPGVAFNYRYAFRLPNARIAGVQEQHAQACERLGVTRCRITGLRYRVIDEDHVSAMLALKLEPTIARNFGNDAAGAVRKAEGMLVDTEISGTDVGTGIARAGKAVADRRVELDRLEAQLARGDLRPGDRSRIEAQIAELRRETRAIEAQRTDAQDSLATTPMVFDYGAGGLIPGFEGGSPIRDAFASAIGSFVTMLSFIIIAIGALLPWGFAIGLVVLLARSSIGRRLRAALPRKTDAPDAV